MFSFRVFFSVTTFFVGLCIVVDIFPLPADPFASKGTHLRRGALDQPAEKIAALKFVHAERSEKFELGFFGNSRIIYVSQHDLGISGKRFFNFGVFGSSFRQSIRFIEALNKIGKTPETIVISMDNVALDNAGLPAIYPAGITELIDFFRDFNGLFGAPYAKRSDFNTQIHTPVRQYAKKLGRIFNPVYLMTRLEALHVAYFGGRSQSPGQYGADGSYCCLTRSPQNEEIVIPEAYGRTDLPYPLLEEDMRRLSVATQGQTKVIIYESPLHPLLHEQIEDMLDDKAIELRNRVRSACRKYGYVCHPSLPLKGDDGELWVDNNHPPSKYLGPFLRLLIEEVE